MAQRLPLRGFASVVLTVGLLASASAMARPPVNKLPAPTGPTTAPRAPSPPRTPPRQSPAPTPSPKTQVPIGPTASEALDPDRPPPCQSHDECAPGDADGDAIRDAWERVLAAKYAPELRLPPSSKDWTRPANVDWYLARVHMRFENTGACNRDVQILAVGKVTQANMALQSRRTKSMTFTGCKENGALRFSHNSKRFFLQPPNDAVHKGAPHSEWKTYVHVKRSQAKPDGYDIQYWYFFPYNDSIASFNHEGDWEHITVTTDAAGAFVEAFYAQHEGGKVYKSDDLQMVLGQHPVVYIADGSHASYPRRDHFDIPKVPGLDDHTYDGGPVWQTWRSLIHVGEKNRPLNNQRFLSYGGRWGEIGTTDVTSGPEGPAFQSAWTTR